MKIRTLLLLSLFLCSCQEKETAEIERPNILFIMGDDHTTQAISCYNGLFADFARTENIDRLAAEGFRFDQAFCTNAICSPSRATILTGKYSHKNGVYILGQPFDSTQTTSASLLQQAGYHTAVFGKWHLKSRPAYFDTYKVLQVQGRYQDPQFLENDSDQLKTYEGWATDVIADMTIDHLRKQKGTDKPFFVMCHFKATHDPWASRPPFDTLFQDIDLPEPENLFDEYENRSNAAKMTTLKLELINQSTFPHQRLENVSSMEQRRYIYQQYIKDFLRCGRVLDENVGRILDFLDEEGFSENTIVIYTADQGHFLGEHGFFSKRFIYEEAMRIPLIIRSPDQTKSGTTSQLLVENTDIAPTIVDLAGLAVPTEMQGRSLKPVLSGTTPEDWRSAIYYRYWQHILHRRVPAHYGIRTAQHKLIFYHGMPLGLTNFDATEPEWEFFDLVNDPHEMVNSYNDPAQKETVALLKKQLGNLKRELGDEDAAYPKLDSISREHF